MSGRQAENISYNQKQSINFLFSKKDSYTGYLYYLLLKPFSEHGFMEKDTMNIQKESAG